MKLFLRLSFAIAATALFFSVFAISETKAQGQLNEILKRMETHRNQLSSLRAGVLMDKYNSQLGIHDMMKGDAAYLPSNGRDATFRIDWVDPEETLSVVNKKYVIYRPRLKQAIVGNANKAKGSGKANNLFAFLNMSKTELKKNYSVKYLGQEKLKGGTPTWHLEMTPNNKTQFKSAEMWIDGNGMPLQIKMTENNNDTTTILLSNLQKNVTLKASYFEVKLPKGTKEIAG